MEREEVEKELLNSLAECVPEINDIQYSEDSYPLLEKTMVRVCDLLNHKKIPYKDFRG